MNQPRKEPVGAGAIMAFTIIAGTICGGLMGQPSAGLLGGTALGIVIALLLWLRDRKN